jgi:hypothetical protein
VADDQQDFKTEGMATMIQWLSLAQEKRMPTRLQSTSNKLLSKSKKHCLVKEPEVADKPR